MSSFSDEELAEFKEVFGYFADKDSGRMPSDDLGTLMRGLGKNPLEAEIEAMMKEVGDSVDFAGFLTCMEKPLKEKNQFTPEEIFEAFECFDAEQSGQVDKNELRKVMQELGEPYTDKEFEMFMGEADPDGTGKVNYKAFIKNVTSKKKKGDDDD
jgi:calmodulin